MTAVVIKGLAEHKDELGAPLCPCRHYDDKVAEAQEGFWNCPCVPMRERKVRPSVAWRCEALPMHQSKACTLLRSLKLHFPEQPPQECHCMLFLQEGTDFAGDLQAISLDEVVEHTKGM